MIIRLICSKITSKIRKWVKSRDQKAIPFENQDCRKFSLIVSGSKKLQLLQNCWLISLSRFLSSDMLPVYREIKVRDEANCRCYHFLCCLCHCEK